MAKFLEDKFPELKGKITGDIFPTPPIGEFMSNGISLLQFVGIAWMILGGDKLLRMVGYNTLPSFYWTIQDNPVPLAIFLFLLAPNMVAKLSSGNGAFEIYLDEEIVFSKLESGAFPTIDQLIDPLVKAGLVHIDA